MAEQQEDPFEGVVFFTLPNGTKISNDPKFRLAEMRAAVIAERPHTGVEALRDAEVRVATVGSGVSGPQSAQGVGDEGDSADVLAGRMTGRSVQHQDRILAEMTGKTSTEPAVTPTTTIDANEEVLKLREEGEPATDLDELTGVAYEDWPAAALKEEVKRRKAEGREINTEGVTRKAQLAAVLREDDQAKQRDDQE